MRILHVINRIRGRLLYCQIEIKLKVRIRLAQIKEESCCIDRNIFKQRNERQRFSAALGLLNRLSVPHDCNHLHQNHFKLGCIHTECSQRCLQTRYIAVVIGAEHIDRLIKVTGNKLIIMVRDIRYYISI